jgi:hypothetical protein
MRMKIDESNYQNDTINIPPHMNDSQMKKIGNLTKKLRKNEEQDNKEESQNKVLNIQYESSSKNTDEEIYSNKPKKKRKNDVIKLIPG